VPTMFHRLLGLPDELRQRLDLKSLRVILHGAAPCPVHVKQAMMEWLGPIVYEYYASTEGFGSFVRPEVWLQRPGTVGKPAPDQVRILDDAGQPVPPSQVGKIYLRAPEGARFEYFKDEAKTASAYRSDQPYYTLGDMGYMDEEGFLFLSDRSADVIISGGVNIYPAEIDAVLLTHPGVADTATVGVPDDDWGEAVRAVITLRNGYAPGDALEHELIEHCRARLAHFKCPRRVDFVDELPRHDTGKIYRRLVRDRYWQGRERRI
jgi:long-chain acyl-CoA synthetase